MTIYTGVTSFSESSGGDTNNGEKYSSTGTLLSTTDQASMNYPKLAVLNVATFSGAIASSFHPASGSPNLPRSDHDYFAIDIADGLRDYSGSVPAGSTLRFSVSWNVPGGLDISYRLTNQAYNDTFGPYGSSTFYRSSVDGPFRDFQLATGAGAEILLIDLFATNGLDYTGSYTINISLVGGGGGGGGDTTAPTLLGTSPADNSNAVNVSQNITLAFSEDVKRGSGNVIISRSDGSTFEVIPVTDASRVTVSGNDVTINPTAMLQGSTSYYVTMSVGTIQDLVGNNFTGLTNSTQLNFTTASTNRAPVGINDTLTTAPGTINILSNDSDPDGDALRVSRILANPTYGTVTFDSVGNVSYTPLANLTPEVVSRDGYIRDSVQFEIVDGRGGTASETLNIQYKHGDWYVVLQTIGSGPGPSPVNTPNNQPNSPTIPVYTPSQDKLTGVLNYNETVVYHFDVSTSITEYMDYWGEAIGDPANGITSDPSLRADTFNNEPNLWNQKMNPINVGFSENPRWYEDPLMPGKYDLVLTDSESTVDPPETNTIINFPLDYEINRVFIPDYAGNSPYWARDLGAPGSGRTTGYAERVSRGDGVDYYKFTLTERSAVALSLVTQNALAPIHLWPVDVQGFNHPGLGIPLGFRHYAQGASYDVQVNGTESLAAGTYYFYVDHSTGYDFSAVYRDGVSQAEEQPENYKVFVTTWSDATGNTAVNARNMGSLTANAGLNVAESVSIADPSDWYAFSVQQASTVSFGLTYGNPSFQIGLEFARFNPLDPTILPATNNYIVFSPNDANGNATGFTSGVLLDANVTYFFRVYARETYPVMSGMGYSSPFIFPDFGGGDYSLNMQTTVIPVGTLPDITGDPGANIFLGGTAASTYRGQGGGDTINAGGGDDTVVGGAGNNTYDGGTGFNTLDYTGATGAVVVDLVAGTAQNGFGGADNVGGFSLVTSGPGADWLSGDGLANALRGNAGNDVLFGGDGVDTLDGGLNDDLLDGGIGPDAMSGGPGKDTYVIDNPGDTVTETTDASIDQANSSVSFTLPANVENLSLLGTSNISAGGNTLGNLLIGNTGNNIIDGGGGADIMIGGAGNDTYIVDNAGDVVAENPGGGVDTVNSTVSYALGANIENLSLTGNGNNNAIGNELANVIIGNAGQNAIDGGASGDTMFGGGGNDVYVVDNALDTVNEGAGAGTDTVNSFVAFTLPDNVEHLTLLGTANVAAGGNELTNTLIGNAGNNVLDAGPGGDSMFGGGGNDVYVVDNPFDSVNEGAGAGTDTVNTMVSFTLSANVENISLLGAGNIASGGNTLANVMIGNAGNNVLDGGAGRDTMFGGLGNDTYIVDDALDSVNEGANAGIDTINSTVAFTMSANIENLTLLGASDISASGNDLANVMIGNAARNTLDGGADGDTMFGQGGDDTYFVDNMLDTVNEGANAGNDTVNTFLSFNLPGNVENVSLLGTADLNTGGNELANVLIGNSGWNILDGSAGADIMIGGGGNDTYVVDHSGDVVAESAGGGVDTVNSYLSYNLVPNVENLSLLGVLGLTGVGNELDNVIIGNSGANVLAGASGNDILLGGIGRDTIDGGSEWDTINGGPGVDLLTGGGGVDGFFLDQPAGAANADLISDFTSGTDRLLLSLAAFGPAPGFAFDGGTGELRWVNAPTADNLIVTLQNVSILGPNDLVLY